ncbi:MAG: hypothetical protein ACYC27_12050 [Armatimonadota bacterium]
MTRKKSLTTVLVLTGTMILGAMALAQNANQNQTPNNGGNQGQNPNRMMNQQNMRNNMCPVRLFPALPQQSIEAITPTLQLTADQQANASKIFTKLTKDIAEIRGKNTYNQSLMDEMKRSTTDSARVDALGNAIMEQEKAILKAELKAWMEFKKTLNATQQTALWNMTLNPQMNMNRGQWGQGGQRQGGQRLGGQRNNQQNQNQQQPNQQPSVEYPNN